MDSGLRATWGRRLYSQLPLVGGWLRLRAVDMLARDDSPEAVRLLAEAVARSDDRRVCIEALEVLQEVERPRCIEAVCEVWAATRNVYLEELLTVADWVAKAPVAVRVLYQMVKAREDEVAAGGPEVVEPLLQYCSDADTTLAQRARATLARLTSAEAQEALCRAVIDRDEAMARAIALAAGYAPREAGMRALFYFLTEQWDAYESLDFDRSLLRAVYRAADSRLRQRIAELARAAGRVEWVEVVTGGRHQLRLAEMTDTEWQTTLDVLVSGKQWTELWRLAQEAPPRWAARLLQRLEKLEGLGLVRAGLEEMVRLARLWQEPGLSASLRPRAILTEPAGPVRCIALSPDSSLLASSGGDNTLRLWRLPDGAALRTLEGHQDEITCLAISPRGKVLVSGGRDHRVCFWELPEGTPLAMHNSGLHRDPVNCVAISPRGKVVASGDNHGTIWLWNLADGRPLQRLREYSTPVRCLAISPDGQLLASGDGAGMVWLWSLPKGELLRRTLVEPLAHGVIASLAFSPDGHLLAAGGDPHNVYLLSVPGHRVVRSLEGHANRIGCIAFSPDGRILASGSSDCLVRLWHLPRGKEGASLAGHIGHVGYLAFSPDSRVLASGGQDGTVELWSVPDGRPLQTLQGHMRDLSGLVISPNGQLLASSSLDGTIRIWTSDLVRLSHTPAGKFSGQDLSVVQEALADTRLSPAERAAVEFLVALVRWRRRFDIEIEEGARRVTVGEYDIILAG